MGSTHGGGGSCSARGIAVSARWIERLSEPELDQYERLIEVPDPALYAWIAGQEAVPADYDCELLQRLRAFHYGAGDTT
jgi:succinate dehydrogenase flavin-adding protein (antitoxin of CptAB toxin-antitoxin module)